MLTHRGNEKYIDPFYSFSLLFKSIAATLIVGKVIVSMPACEVTDEMLSYIDVLVDGPFIDAQKNISLAFRGSENQRVIDLKKSLKEKEVILYLE